jgi:hypothetical protein
MTYLTEAEIKKLEVLVLVRAGYDRVPDLFTQLRRAGYSEEQIAEARRPCCSGH